jgi:NADPH:quinone reductase-like Zn-dependent oxidoreductase
VKAARLHPGAGPSVNLDDVSSPHGPMLPTTVQIEVHASSVNPHDCGMIRQLAEGVYEKPSRLVPIRLGHDLSGIVTAVGSAVSNVAVGDEVYSTTAKMGAWAEEFRVHHLQVARRPRTLSHAESAALAMAGSTARHVMRVGKVSATTSMLVIGASGGVGHLAVQIASKVLGARVTAVTSGRNADYVRGLGVAEVVDYTTHNIRDLPEQFDVILDAVGGESPESCAKILKPGGYLIGLVGHSEEVKRTIASTSRDLGWRLRGLEAPFHFRTFLNLPRGSYLRELASWVDAGLVEVEVEKTYDLAEIQDAIDHVERGRTRGKVAVSVR